MSFPNTNWEINQSPEKEENDALNVIARLNAEQIVDVSICGKKTLDVVFIKNIGAETHRDNKFEEIYDISDHKPVSVELSLNVVKNKPIYECYCSSSQQIMMKSAITCSPTLSNLNVTQTSRE